MRKIRLFIAMSLDGYIADRSGRVDWLNGQGNDDETIDTYSEFVKNIDTVLMGGILIIRLLRNFPLKSGFMMILLLMSLPIKKSLLAKKSGLQIPLP